MKILVTGSAGFIGWKTAAMLLKQGAEVTGIDNLNEYYDPRLKDYRLSELKKQPGFCFYKADIENIHELQPIFDQHDFDAVLNLAARAGVRYSMENPHIYIATNIIGTLNLLEMMKQHSISKLVLASTSSLYAGQAMPFTEDMPVNTPVSPYAASKKGAEAIAYSYHYLYGMDVSILRYFTVYGPAGRPDMSIFRFIKWIDEGMPLKLYGDGNQSRDFTYVDDIALGTIKAIKKVGYEIVNLGGGRNPLSLNEVIRKIETALGKKAVIENSPFPKADLFETQADISKAMRLFEWHPRVDIEEGLNNTVGWYKENKSWLRGIKI
ncbi:MAG: GDP-mannose 4,6-dehydratase [Candidatus Aureabacteria bacterium]|nr:GDP-mannose 4,6-dehydratase [Candidatus Auribacterota bacterium]